MYPHGPGALLALATAGRLCFELRCHAAVPDMAAGGRHIRAAHQYTHRTACLVGWLVGHPRALGGRSRGMGENNVEEG